MAHWLTDQSDSGKLQTMRVFSHGLAERAELFGVSQADAAEALRLFEAADAAYGVASNSSTRTAITIAAKSEAVKACERFCATLVSFIKHNPNVRDADRMSIGVPCKAERRRVGRPTTEPILAIHTIVPGGHTLEMFDSTNPTRRKLAPDVKGLELVVAYSPSNGGTGEGLGRDSIIATGKPHGILTRGLSKVIHPNERVGSVANYVGRWINRRGEAGPWSQPVRMVLVLPGDAKKTEAA